jgi:RNA polymerase sigma-70 factor, ECF subfamily
VIDRNKIGRFSEYPRMWTMAPAPARFKAGSIDEASAFVMITAVFRGLWALVQADDTNETPSARWQRLLAAAQNGDRHAYTAFLKETAVFVRVIARRYHRDAGAVEDIVQETLLSLHRVRHTYEPGRPVEPWVAAIAKARAIDALRARQRRAAVETETPAPLTDIPDAAAGADARHETQAEVAAALASLPASQRAAVRMLKIEELSLAQASERSGQSVPALKSLLHRAMLTLKSTLRGGGDA